MLNSKNLINYLGFLFLAIILFGAGFYFGHKNALATQANTTSSTTTINSSKIPSETENNKNLDSINNIKDLEAVFWIKPGTEPICPQNYLIKGKFGESGTNYYYTKENKFYERTKADICFATEEFAKDKAGFIKKF